MACGYTWPEIDAMTLPAFNELCRYWQHSPPTHLLMRGLLGDQPRARAVKPPADLADLFALAPGGTLLSRRNSGG